MKEGNFTIDCSKYDLDSIYYKRRYPVFFLIRFIDAIIFNQFD